MTRTTTSTDSINLAVAMAQFDATQQAHQSRSTTALAQNKEVLFAAMRRAGITEIIVTFDGAGDSGQIEDISVRRGEDVVPMPEIELEIAHVSWGISEITRSRMALDEAVETLAYDLLADTHGGWENCDGAFGEFHFDSGAGTILLDYNERFTSSEKFNHTF